MYRNFRAFCIRNYVKWCHWLYFVRNIFYIRCVYVRNHNVFTHKLVCCSLLQHIHVYFAITVPCFPYFAALFYVTFILDSTNNPWKVSISYGEVAPWMETHSHKSVILSNTEHKKGKSMANAKPGKISPTRNLSHDSILDHLLNLDQVFFTTL